ncbi:hypothetical protein METP3_00250 [Methanosarcinales archaeon]|nr:hypothetical protein METP3_00250 [Methanosarcinales archaeon]
MEIQAIIRENSSKITNKLSKSPRWIRQKGSRTKVNQVSGTLLYRLIPTLNSDRTSTTT